MKLWKICRAINNEKRLELLCAIARSPDKSLNVVEAGDFVGLGKAAASQYLRQLAEAGFVSVERSGRFAVCSLASSSATVASLLAALAESFPSARSKKKDWHGRLLRVVNGLSHHVRTRIVRRIVSNGGAGFADLEKTCSLAPATLRRQLGVLIDAGLVSPCEDETGNRCYAIADGLCPVASALLAMAANECSQFANCEHS